MWHGEFRRPRLVEIYDAQFSWSREDDFFFEQEHVEEELTPGGVLHA